MLLAATGLLAYGGEAHHLLAGSTYLGSGYAMVAPAGEWRRSPPCKAEELHPVELYEVPHYEVSRIAQRLALSITEVEVRCDVGSPRRAVALVQGCRVGRVEWRSRYTRWLVVVPPAARPPTTPLAMLEAEAPLIPAPDGYAFTTAGGGVGVTLHDVVVPFTLLEEWTRSLSAEPLVVEVRLRSGGVGYAVAPIRRGSS